MKVIKMQLSHSAASGAISFQGCTETKIKRIDALLRGLKNQVYISMSHDSLIM